MSFEFRVPSFELMNLDEIEKVAIEAHRAGGQVLRRHFRRLARIDYKGHDYNLTTVADHNDTTITMQCFALSFLLLTRESIRRPGNQEERFAGEPLQAV